MAAINIKVKEPSLLMGKNYIDGQWVDAASGATFDIHDPATGTHLGSCPESEVEDAEKAIAAASAALPAWKARSGRDRSRVLRRWYDLVIENKEDLASIITHENGKSLADAVGEVVFSAGFLEWFSEEAARVYGDVIPHSSSAFRVQVVKEPVGVCGLITPWNFPAGMITRKLAPALAAGCTAVIKTPGETPFSATALAVLAERAGVPRGVINIVSALDNTPRIGETLCYSPIVKKISFTGSTRVGRLLMNQSSGTIKKMSLELGGNAPFIVFDDANLKVALKEVVTAKFKNSGQTCVCANRIFLQRGIYNDFVAGLQKAAAGLKVGSGHDSDTTHGPLIGKGAVEKVTGLVDDAVAKGATVVAGGKALTSLGPNFFEPTILTNITLDMRIAHEEIFGPVASIYVFDSEEEVIQAANCTEVGLASYVFTENVARAQRMTEALESGMVALNSGVVSDWAAPFGGVKQSGLGREGSKYGIEDYLQMKTIVTGNFQQSRL